MTAVRILCVSCGPRAPAMRKGYGTFSDMIRLTLQRARARAACIGGGPAFAATAPTNITQSVLGKDEQPTERPATPRSCRNSDTDAPVVAGAVAPVLTTIEEAQIELVEVRIYSVDGVAGEALPEDVSGYAGAIFSGSTHNVTEMTPWMEAACDWIRRHALRAEDPSATAADRLPMLGICFGHQLIGMALGGTCASIGSNQLGSIPIAWNAAAAEAAKHDPVFGSLYAHTTTAAFESAEVAEGAEAPKPTYKTGKASFPVGAFIAQSAHTQALTVLPPGATAWAATTADANSVVKFGPLTYGVQFHPEYTCQSMQDMLLAHAVGPHADHIRQQVMALCGTMKDAFDAPAIVSCFVATAIKVKSA